MDIVVFMLDFIKALACVVGAVFMTMYFIKETKPLREQYNNPESDNYQSKKLKIDLKASTFAYSAGIVCLLAIAIVVFVL